MSWRQLPNTITAARIGMVPLLIWLMREGEYLYALGVGAAAALSDAADGYLAKRHGWQTQLGAVLDPIADKLLLAALFVGLWSAALIPGWLVLLVLARDAVIVSGALTYHVLVGPLQARPTLLGKSTTVIQIAYVLAGLLQLSGVGPALAREPAVLVLVVGVTLASGLDYMQHWARLAWRARRGNGVVR